MAGVGPTPDEISELLADLADISGRMRRFEPVSDAEIEAFKVRKRAVVEAIEPGFYDR